MIIELPEGQSGAALVKAFQDFFFLIGIRDALPRVDPKTGHVVIKDVESWRKGFEALGILLLSEFRIVSCRESEKYSIYDMSDLPGVDFKLAWGSIERSKELGAINIGDVCTEEIR